MGSPRARLQRRHEVPTGYPTTGLVAYFDLMQDNLLLQTNDLSIGPWVLATGGTGSLPTVTTGQTDKDGGTTAARLQMDRGASDTSADQSTISQLVTLPNPHASAGRLWMRSNDASTYSVIFRDNAAAVASGVLCAVTPTWQSFAYTAQTAVAATSSTFYLGLRGALGCSQTADILVASPQLVPRVTLPDYVATTDLQTLASLYGKTPTLQRGATSGAEASDGSFGASGWVAVTDDYLQSDVVPVTLAGPWTIIFAGGPATEAAAYNTLISIASTGTSLATVEVFPGIGAVIHSRADGSLTESAALAIDTVNPSILSLTNNADVLTLTRLSTGASVTLADTNPTGTPKLYIGSRDGTLAFATMTAALASVHSAVLSTAQLARAYRDMKARGARKGVTLT